MARHFSAINLATGQPIVPTVTLVAAAADEARLSQLVVVVVADHVKAVAIRYTETSRWFLVF